MPKKETGRSLSVTSHDSNGGVMLADLVADVPVHPDGPDHSASATRRRSPEPQDQPSNGLNRGFDGHMDNGNPAVVQVETSERIVSQARSQNGTDITKGVILNAYLDQGLKSGVGKSMELQITPPVEEKTEKGPPEGIRFRDMTPARKVAFGFSFLPSIMFVLCFAVILPCQKRAPCVEVMWTVEFNSTRLLSSLLLPEDLVYGFSQEGSVDEYGLADIDTQNGNRKWNVDLSFRPQIVGCGKFYDPHIDSCLVLEPTGAFNLFNASNGQRSLQVDVFQKQNLSAPAVLPDCQGEGYSSFVTSFAKAELKVVHRGSMVTTVQVPGCDSVPDRLTPWSIFGSNETDLLILCRKEKNDALIRIPQSMWCTDENGEKVKDETVVLDTKKADGWKNAQFLPTPQGLVAWTDNEVQLVSASGNKNWTMSTLPHSGENRVILYGKFKEAGTQIALFSSDLLKGFMVTLLSSETGETIRNQTLTGTEVTNIVQVQGANKEFVLLSTRKASLDPAKQAVNQLSEVSTTLLSILAEEHVGGSTAAANSTGSSFSHEISFLELGGKLHVVHQESVPVEDNLYKISLKVLPKKTDGLDVIVFKTPSGSEKTDQVEKLRIRNWDITLPESQQCAMK